MRSSTLPTYLLGYDNLLALGAEEREVGLHAHSLTLSQTKAREF
jgi:hypothetical protein